MLSKIFFGLLFLAVISSNVLYAQKDTWLVYGNVGVSSTQDTSSANRGFWNINAGGGYQFTNNWIGGVRGGYFYAMQHKNGSDKASSFYNGGLFIRYVHPLSGIFCYYGQVNLSYVGGQREVNGTTNLKWNGVSVNLIPAIRADVGNGVGLTFGVGGLDYNTVKYNSGAKSSLLNLSFGRNVFIGMSKKLGGHHKAVQTS